MYETRTANCAIPSPNVAVAHPASPSVYVSWNMAFCAERGRWTASPLDIIPAVLRTRRILFDAITAGSLVLCVLLCKTKVADSIKWGDDGPFLLLLSGDARFGTAHFYKSPGTEDWATARYDAIGDVRIRRWQRGRQDHWDVNVAWTTAVPVAAALPIARVAAAIVRCRRAARRIAAARCGSCGYDLRATPERCPECGAIPKATADD
jgi:hypothetical protein